MKDDKTTNVVSDLDVWLKSMSEHTRVWNPAGILPNLLLPLGHTARIVGPAAAMAGTPILGYAENSAAALAKFHTLVRQCNASAQLVRFKPDTPISEVLKAYPIVDILEDDGDSLIAAVPSDEQPDQPNLDDLT